VKKEENKNIIRKTWMVFLLECEFAKEYKLPYSLNIGIPPNNPILDRILPTLLFIRATGILDEVLIDVLLQSKLSYKKKQYPDNLCGRISLLQDNNILKKSDGLHNIRKKRNIFSHENNKWASWEELSSAIDLIDQTLHNFGYVNKRPHFDCFIERSALKSVEDPKIMGVQDYRCGIKADGKLAMEFSWRESLFRDQRD